MATKKKKILLVAGAVFIIACAAAYELLGHKDEDIVREAPAMEHTYSNPMKLVDEWEDYGIGDPYVLRHNGKYYLYCSTKDWRVGIKAWSSDNLVDWTYEGLVTEDPLTEGAYAPEVVYWNGSFYMYTSPAGKGHYVLQSDSPTGPFEVRTGNFGLTIDGSVFIDDDAKWYFTRAETGGIVAHAMTDPLTVESAGEKLNTSLGHWTEGSSIIKRGGRYFMTYTGNHVFSKGYRVNYGVKRDSPLGIYTIPENNPIIISTEDDFNGLGHSATVMGPDMDSYYIVYHNLIGRSAEGPPVRMFNMDRLLFNGDKMSVNGPTYDVPMQAPALPVFHDALGGGASLDESRWEQVEFDGTAEAWVAREAASGRFTAEFNAVVAPSGGLSEDARFSAVFSYEDAGRYRAVELMPGARQLALKEVSDGKAAVLNTAPLPEGMDLAKLHAIRSESDRDGTRVYWDGLLLIDNKELRGASGKIGYAWTSGMEPELHYTAFSNDAGGSSDRAVVKHVPGILEAAHGIGVGGEAAGRDDHAAGGNDAARIGVDGADKDGKAVSGEHGVGGADKDRDAASSESGEGGAAALGNGYSTPDGSLAVQLEKGSPLSFPITVKESGSYLFSAMVSRDSVGAELKLSSTGESRAFKVEERWFAEDADWIKVPLGTLQLKSGPQWLTLSPAKGKVTLRYIESLETTTVSAETAISYDEGDQFGTWIEEDGQFRVMSEARDSKLFAGDPRWTDYKVEFDLTLTEDTLGEAALLLRTSNESDFGDQVADSFMGYELAFRNGRVILRRISYEINEELDSGQLELTPGNPERITVKLEGNVIAAYAGENDEPLLSWTDPNAFLRGRIGLRTGSTGWAFSNVNVYPLD
jgi:xylan 1,4-beta-xylosidase